MPADGVCIRTQIRPYVSSPGNLSSCLWLRRKRPEIDQAECRNN